MNTGTILFRALMVLTVLTTVPHAFAMLANSTNVEKLSGDKEESVKTEIRIEKEETLEGTYESDQIPVQTQHPLVGYWYTTYNELEIGVTYEFREEQGEIKGYSIELYDKDGNKMTDNTLVVKLISFEGQRGKAKYFMEYEGEKYEVDSDLKLKGKILEVSYSYYGYDSVEKWEKVD